MNRRTSGRECAFAAVALLGFSSLAGGVMGQQQDRLESGTVIPLHQSLGVQATVSDENEASSVEEGRTPLDQAFGWRQPRPERGRGALQDTRFEFDLRTEFIDRNKFDGTESEAWAIGGWVGLKTGYFLDHVAFGITGYTSQPLYAPINRGGTGLLQSGQQGYTVLGEAYADLQIMEGLNIDVGRKGFDTPFINRDDTRMTPNTFEAIVLQGRTELDKSGTKPAKEGVEQESDVAVLKYGVGYFDKIKARDSDEFVSMSVDAGAAVERGVYAAGALYEKGEFSLGAIDYYSSDIINIGYAEAKMELPISSSCRPKLAAQFTTQHSVGSDRLQGQSFSGKQFGIKADLPVGRALFTAAYTYTFGGADMQNPWSSYPGYTSVQVQDFFRAGENAFLLRAGYKFPWVKGLSAYALAVFGTNPDQTGQDRQDEYDFNLQWVPPKGVLDGLSVRMRYAVVDQHGGDVNNLTEFRALCNYVIKF